MPFELPKLSYDFNALEPYLDARTMEIHYSKHHAGYVRKLNNTLKGRKAFVKITVEDILKEINKVPEDIKSQVINNGGGHANHTLFWKTMNAKGNKTPKGDFARTIDSTFGDFNSFKEKFTDIALKRFGSGWAWLALGKMGLEIFSTANQNSPLMQGKKPILVLDVWEHAYYLKYQNRRDNYIKAWWNVVNWDEVNNILVKEK